MKIRLKCDAPVHRTIRDLPVLTVARDRDGDIVLRTADGFVILTPGNDNIGREYDNIGNMNLPVIEVYGVLTVDDN